MRTLVSALLLFCFAGVIDAQTNVSGNINKDSTWTLAGSPYKVIASFTVNAGFTLRVDSGVVVRFQSGTDMFVSGSLHARQATFTSSKDTAGGTPVKGDWAAIYLNNASATIVLDTCTMKFGGGAGHPMLYASSAITSAALTNCSILNSNYWGIYLNASSFLTLTNCTISNSNSHGVYLNAPTMSVTGTVVSSSAGLGMQLNGGTNATVSNCTISGSSSGQGLWISSTNSSVSNCTITGSNSNGLQINAGTNSIVHKTTISTSNGVGLYLGATNATADSCTISGSSTHGIHVVGADSILACSVTNSSDRGVYVQSGSATLVGCTITSSTNQGLFFDQNTNIVLTNSTISYSASSNGWPIWYNGQASLVFNGTNTFTGPSGFQHKGIYMNFSTTNANFVLDTVAIPFFFPYGLTVNAGHTMTIASTDVLKFSGSLTVNGALKADAATGQNIYFTSYRNDNLPVPGSDTNADGASTPVASDWYGIIFNASNIDTTSIMRRCSVTFAGAANTGGITMYNASPTIDSCNIATNYIGVMMQYVSNPKFTNNTIGSSVLVPIAMAFTANPVVFSNNVFSNSDNTYDAIGLLGGTLTANATLPIRSILRINSKSGILTPDTISNVTYLMLDQITIPVGMTLTINKGVVIKGYQYWQRFVVQGKMVADASPDSLIVFTSVSDDNFGHPNDTEKNGNNTNPARGNWGGITFESGSDSTSILNYCSLHYGALPYYYYYYDNIYLNGGLVTTINLAKPTISNCIVDQGVYGIYAFGNSRPQIINTQIINSQYTPVAMSIPANPFFQADTFINSGWTALGIIGEVLGASGTVMQRTVSGYPNITYVLLADLTINTGTNVTINPGVVIKMNGCGIYVNGGFKAKGTIAGGNVIFTSLKDDNFGNPGDTNRDGNASAAAWADWSTIRFQATSDDVFSLIDSCQINYAGNGSWGGITYTDAGSTISNSTIFKSYNYGIRFENSSAPTVNNVTLNGCRLDPFAMSLFSNPNLQNITFAANGSRGIRILEGTVSSNVTLAQRSVAGISNIAYIIDNVTVNAGAIFTINPGVVIKFSIYYNAIAVNGALVANGTPAQKIIFTSISDDSNGGDTNNDGNGSSPAKGNWATIDFGASSADTANSMRNCEFRYGGGYNYSNDYGIVRVYNSNVVIDSCVFSQSPNSGFGVFGSGHPIITNCQINNVSLTPVTMSMFSTPSSFATDSALNVGYMAIGIKPETYSITATVPVRSFGPYSNITYLLYGTNTINTGTTITIPSGMVFKDGNWVVNGALVTSGTPSQKVVFTDSRDDSYGNPGDTNVDGFSTQPAINGSQRIQFNDVSTDSTSFIQNTIFRYTDGGIYLYTASPRILDCTFEHDNWGVYLDGVSNPSIDSCLFKNLIYAPMRISLVSYPTSTLGDSISGTTFKAIAVKEGEILVQDVTLSSKTFAGIKNIPWLFGNYTVANNSVLTFSPGLIVKFFPLTGMTVRKGLVAEGNSQTDSAIVFTDLRDDFYGNDTNSDSTLSSPTTFQYPQYWYPGWNGITYTSESLAPLCRIRNAIFRYAGIYYGGDGAALTFATANGSVTYSSFSNNYNAITTTGASNPVIHYNDIFKNAGYGVKNVNKSFNIAAQNNWWGSNTGPTHSGNPGGTGQAVTDSVSYLPFGSSSAMNPIIGDVSLNGQVQAFDASLILKWLVDDVTYPLNSNQQQVADVSGNGIVQAMDASLILQYTAGVISIFPAVIEHSPTPIPQLQKSASIAQVALSPGYVERGKQVTISISAASLKNLYAVEIGLAYNKDQLTPVSVTSEGVMASATLASSMRDGSISIALASASAISGDGALFAITFQAADDIKGDVKSAVTFTKFIVNETDMKAQTSDATINIKGKPTSFALNQNYPNPFNPSTTISYQVPEDGLNVKIAIYNIMGQLVRTLVDGPQRAGEYKVVWEGTNDFAQHVSSGIYLFRMTSNKFVSVRKMLFVK